MLRNEARSGRPYRVISRSEHGSRTPAPVLFVLHAYATSPDEATRGYLLDVLAVQARGYIVVVPEGLPDGAGKPAWNASAACCRTSAHYPDDLGYLRAVLAEVARDYPVDRGRVMALGVSNGGFMAYRWACAPGAELSAFVSIAGAGRGPEDPPCSPPSPVSVLHIHGDADDVIAYEGGVMSGHAYPSALGSLAPFLLAADAVGEPGRSRVNRPLLGELDQREWSGAGAKIALWTVRGGQHKMKTVRTLVFDILEFLDASRRTYP